MANVPPEFQDRMERACTNFAERMREIAAAIKLAQVRMKEFKQAIEGIDNPDIKKTDIKFEDGWWFGNESN